MGESCKECMGWEEEMYWTHFQSIHFSQLLLADFDKRLVIPEKFAMNCRKKLPGTVTIKSPSGKTYSVGLATENDTLVFYHGWEEFVKDHFLEANDLLIFKFNGVSHFDVLIFDSRSLCEKVSSYFIRKCGHEEHESGRCTKRKMAGYSGTSSSAGINGTPEKPMNDNMDTTPIQEPIISLAANENRSDGKYQVNTYWTMQRLRSNELSNLVSNVEAKPDIRQMSMNAKVSCSSSMLLSKRRPITEAEKRNALFLAQAATTPEGFMVVMKRTHVSSKYYLTIPNSWVNKYLSPENQEVVLRMNKSTWHTGFGYLKSRKSGALSTGWRKFVLDNRLDEFDVCVFEPVSLSTKPLLLDVSIFRATGQAVDL